MKKAFTLYELILTLVIIAILATVGIMSFHRNITQMDGSYIISRIKQTQYQAIGDEVNHCLVLTAAGLAVGEDDSNVYNVRSNIAITNLNVQNRLCFDGLGRVYNGNAYDNTNNLQIGNLLMQNVQITLTDGDDRCRIRVARFSGYASIRCEN